MGIERMRAGLEYRGLAAESLPPMIQIAGTNGKGSVSAMLASVLSAAGYRTGLFTSPHLHRYTERIQIDGQPIGTREAARRIGELLEAFGKPGAPFMSFFELSTLMAAEAFRDHACDIAVMEVGLGGREDATNALPAVLAVITRIAFDHENVLGKTLAEIADAKAGIIKPRVPVVVGSREQEAKAVIRRVAKEQKAPARWIDKEFGSEESRARTQRSTQQGAYAESENARRAAGPAASGYIQTGDLANGRRARATKRGARRADVIPSEGVARQGNSRSRMRAGAASADRSHLATNGAGFAHGSRVSFWVGDERIGPVELGLPGDHQRDNAACAVAALIELRKLGFQVPRRAIVNGLEKVRWPARLERVPGKPAHLLDAAHNPDGAAALAEFLRAQPERPRVLVFGVMQDKEYPAMLRSLAPEVDAVFYARPRVPRAQEPRELQKIVPGVAARSVSDALARAKRRAGRAGLVVVAGSIFLVAEARAKLLRVPTDPLIRM